MTRLKSVQHSKQLYEINHMNKLAAILVSAIFSISAFAASPSPESVDALLIAMNVDRAGDTLFGSMDQAMKQQVGQLTNGENLTPEKKKAMEASLAKTIAIMREELSWAKMQSIYRQVYQESFTQEEIDGLLAFYKSSAGAAFVNKMPVVMQKTMTVMQSRMGPMLERFKAAAVEAKSMKW